MARRKHYRKPKYARPSRNRAKTEEKKARSIQSSWRKATNRTDSLTIDQARALVEDPPTCQYCNKPIPWADLSIDHVIPRSRGGPDTPSNLVWTDRTCNLEKGDLTDIEFKALLGFLRDYPKMRDSILTRMRVAGAVYGRKRKWRR